MNLVYCPQLPMFIPAGNSSKAIPRGLCKVCLFTGFMEGSNCRHSTVNSWRKSYCDSGGMHYMLCRACPRHQLGQQWWKDHHNPQLGYMNYLQIMSDLTFDKVQASINVITVTKQRVILLPEQIKFVSQVRQKLKTLISRCRHQSRLIIFQWVVLLFLVRWSGKIQWQRYYYPSIL